MIKVVVVEDEMLTKADLYLQRTGIDLTVKS